jgi:hypothetical protein
MSFELSPNRVRTRRTSRGRGLSIFVTLVSPLLAVLLSQYLNARQKCHTTFAVPVPNLAVRLPEPATPAAPPELPPPEVSVKTEVSAKDPPDAWQSFAPQPQKQALAMKLMASASGAVNDPASQFVMLRRAKDVATEANDGETAFQAIDAMAETFHSDADTLKTSVLTKLASTAQKPAQHKSIAEQALNLGDQALGQGRFRVASQLGRLAVAEAKRSLDNELVARAQRRIADVAEQFRAKEHLSSPSGDWPQQVGARVAQEPQPEAKQEGRTDQGNDLLAAGAKGF